MQVDGLIFSDVFTHLHSSDEEELIVNKPYEEE